MKIIWIQLLFLLLAYTIVAQLGVSTIANKVYPYSVFQCVKNSNHSVVDLVIQSSSTGINNISAQNLPNIKNAGMRAQLWFNPCRTLDPSSQARQLFTKFNRAYYDRVWIAPQGNLDPKCNWVKTNYTAAENCKYLKDIVQEIRFSYQAVGVSSNAQLWEQLFKDKCDDLGSQYLYWTPQTPNEKPNFSDFKPFGGWKKPVVKLYQSAATVCGSFFDLRYSSWT